MLLFFELTRRCNYQCSHCLRGDAQGIDMHPTVMRRALNMFDRHEDNIELGFGGGEALLKPKLIHTFAQELSWSRGSYYNEDVPMWIVSNGKRFLDQDYRAIPYNEPNYDEDDYENIPLVESLMFLKMQTPITLAISTDYWHDEADNGSKDRFEHASRVFDVPDIRVVEHGPKEFRNLLAMGRTRSGEEEAIWHSVQEKPMYYVNVYGDIYPSCNLSYTFQKQFKDTMLNLGNVNTDTLDTILENRRKLDDILEFDGTHVLYVSEDHLGDLEERIEEYEIKVKVNK